MRAVRAGLADQVVEYLLQDITEGVYPPGSQLPPEPVLAEQAGVSRLTLREAIKSLRQRGVVRVEQGRGTFVNETSQWLPFDPKLLVGLVRHDHGVAMQLTEVRGIVEVGAAGLAAKRRKASDLAGMRDALERMKESQAAGDMVAFSHADIDFHLAVLNSVDNYFVPALLAPIDAGLREIRVQTSQERRMNERAIVMHGKIYDAIRKRSARAAADLMDRHLEETKRYIAGMSQ
ncbi:MAG TPA: FadR/GntR family transcriptional regulator [Nocardioidaceae bacterium]|jgi:DNA-binding FadR family transcriptional regulator